MIARSNRFHGHASLHFVYRHGRSVRGALIALKYAPNRRRQVYRAAVVVSKKVNKSAVVRNRIRRRVYEQIRSLSPLLQEPYDLVFTVFSEEVAGLASDKLAATLKDLLKQARVISVETRHRHANMDAKES